MTERMPDPAWNATERDYPAALLHEAFSAQVARDPGAPAVRFRDETLSYAELDARIAQLAARILAMGAHRSLVAVCMERSIEMVVALHAIVRAGCAYVPIDPEYPDDRIGFMLEDLDDPILITQQHLIERLAPSGVRVVPIDVPLDPAEAPTATTLPTVSADDLAYVIYTSGSTGRPKGAINTHRGIANRIYWMQEAFGLTPADKVLQKTPFSFDVSVWEFFWPLLFGAELVVAEPGGHRDSAYLSQTIVERGITTIHFVPSMLQMFLEDPRAGACTSLERVICSGEALPRALQDRFFARLDAQLHNLYGPTEAAVDVSWWACDPASPLPFVPIGKPIANTQLHILDEHLEPVPVGAVGELHIGGIQVGLGYLNRPDLTGQRFIPDPFRPGGRLYKTGDLSRYLPDGNIEFLGRSDFQVKIRGFRVELGEIESALESLDEVRGAVVVAHERSAGDVELVAYIAHPEGARFSRDALRQQLATRLPEYMVPTTFVVMERFPLSANGKVDRKSLPPPVRTRPELGTPYVAPRTELQRRIAASWCRILELDRVGLDDRFFELGGTSLQAARFVNEMQVELGETIFVFTLFGAPSTAEYAAFLEQQFPAAVARTLGTRPAPVAAPSRAPLADREVTLVEANAADAPVSAGGRRAQLSRQRERRQQAGVRHD
jgi:amino acid adenylation domain-containing protein